jgi:hypothetical protein
MPQLDFYSFATQVFFLLLILLIIYFFITFIVIPKYSEVFKLRLKLQSFYFKTSKKPIVLYDRFIKLILESFKN